MEEFEDDFPVQKYTVQLFYSPKRDSNNYQDASPPEQIASGVLIKYNSKHFVITCKHVFENISVEDVVILTRGGLAVRLPNDIKYVDDEKRSIDIALVEFKAERLKELKSRYSFLPSNNLGLSHEFEEDLFYMLYGYINKQTSLEGIAFFTDSYGYLTNIRHYRKFEDLGFSYENNITLEYNRRKQSDLYDVDDKKQIGPKDLKGLSGGGIWLSVEGKTPDTFDYILVGIMIEERVERGFLIGTKIGLIQKAAIKP